TAADVLAKIKDANAEMRSLFLNSLGHVGDGGNDYGLIVRAFEPAITLVDRSDNAGSTQIRSHADGAIWFLRDVTNDMSIGHSDNTTTKVFVKFTLGGPVFYNNSSAEIGRITSAGFVGAGSGLTGVNADKLGGLSKSSFLRTDAGNYKIRMGSDASGNFDGLIFDDATNVFKFIADQADDVEFAYGNIHAGRLRLNATNDLSLSSTAHAFQIGRTDDYNLGMDNNEIQARRNGVGYGLYLNSDGGNVYVNGSRVATDASSISDVRLGAEVQTLFAIDTGVTTWYRAATGFVLTGVRIHWQYADDVMSGYKSRPIQKFINGSWVTIAQV
ncbi:hypothetical protein JI58_08100, partial [Marinosulfonomonas sp. PRT-SC04]